jgi:hypothetical protein
MASVPFLPFIVNVLHIVLRLSIWIYVTLYATNTTSYRLLGRAVFYKKNSRLNSLICNLNLNHNF